MATQTLYRHISEMPINERPLPVTLSREELEEMKLDEAAGRYPPGTVADYEKRLEQAVFGQDVKHDSRGKPIPQGIGAPGHETANHYRALLLREQNGEEAKGVWAAAIRQKWKDDPAAAEKMNLPRPEALAKLNAL